MENLQSYHDIAPYGALHAMHGDSPRAHLNRMLVSSMVQTVDAEEKATRWEQIAKTDDLTELLNERGIMQKLNEWIDQERHFVLLYIDLTNFKKLNDTKGHNSGDSLLISTAAVLRHTVRPTDQIGFIPQQEVVSQVEIGRPHGDEFLVVVDLSQDIMHRITALKYFETDDRRGADDSIPEKILDIIATRIEETFVTFIELSEDL